MKLDTIVKILAVLAKAGITGLNLDKLNVVMEIIKIIQDDDK